MPISTRKAKRAVYAVETTANAKLGAVSATYVAQQSCPASCVFLDYGCFAQNGFVGGHLVKPLNRGVATTMTRVEIAQQEADMIDRLSGERDLRLHVVGDSTTLEGTKLLASASRRFSSKHGRAVWTYSHGWRALPRRTWGSISVLASCESTGDIADARRRGYATALVVPQHTTKRLYRDGRQKILPCPEQTSGVSCVACRLCMRDDYLREAGITIAFAAHGSVGSKGKALAALAAAQAPLARSA
jgi:hypothetical protein